MNPKNIILTKDVSAFIKHAVPVKEGSESYRIIVGILSHSPEKNKLIKDYYVWVTGEYLEDQVKIGNTIVDAEMFALDIVKKRFISEGNTIPKENGVDCSNEKGIKYVNPKTHFHSDEH